MNKMIVPFRKDLHRGLAIDTASNYLRSVEKHPLLFAPWPDHAYKPEVTCSLIQGSDCLYLQFDVKEKIAKAVYGNTNDPVYKDSCVEFFIAPDQGMIYYNFEMNCIGTILGGFGDNKAGRQFLPESLLKVISIQTIMRKQKDSDLAHWELTAVLPFEVFLNHNLVSLRGQKCTGNFYKCGDDLPEPHYLAWSDIKNSTPNFHLPEFFGEITFL